MRIDAAAVTGCGRRYSASAVALRRGGALWTTGHTAAVTVDPARSGLTLGFGLPVSGSWATPGTVAAVARRAEELGYGSLWVFQRVVIPVDDDYGPQYRAVLDPVVALGFAAAVTSRVRLGTAVVNALFLPPAVLAKQLATVDVLSHGRLDVGLGLGWAQHEFAAVGAPYERRGARTAEYVGCLRALWADDPVEFHGEFYDVPPARLAPKPVQRPAPPILLGGTATVALRRAGRIADGWISGSRHDLTAISAAIATIRGSAADSGRDPRALRIVVRGVLQLGDDVRTPEGHRRPLTGTAEQIRDDLRGLHQAGVTEVFLDLNFAPRVGSPDVDPVGAAAHAHEALETFAPSRS
jgi:probable F420-dependent oxidoreductase